MNSYNIMKDEQKREEEDIAKAIELSLKETSNCKREPQPNLYGALLTNNKFNSNSTKIYERDKKKVKAIYDFEAVEDNEISFKAGDILYLIDETDQNWWKGLDIKGNEGLFPSNFVTSELSYNIENYESKDIIKKVSFVENSNIKEVDNFEGFHKTIQSVIDEKKIDECNEMLQNADPTGEIQPDPKELLELEDQCYMMGPLIDKQLQKIDHKHAILEDLNLKILEAFQIYNNLMKDGFNKTSNITQINNLSSGSNMNNSLINPSANPNHVSYISLSNSSDNSFSNFDVANRVNLNIPTFCSENTISFPTSSGNTMSNYNLQYLQTDNQKIQNSSDQIVSNQHNNLYPTETIQNHFQTMNKTTFSNFD